MLIVASGAGQVRFDPPAPVGGGAGVEGAAEQSGALPHAYQAVAGSGAAGDAGGAVVVDGESHLLGVSCDGDRDPGGVAGVASSVRDGLLGEAVDRGPDRGAEVVELTGEGHLDDGMPLAIVGEVLDLGHAGLRCEVAVLRGAQHAHHGAQFGQRPGRRVLDGGEGLDGTLGVCGRDGASCLSLDGDARDVMSNGVVELASELFALSGFGFVDVTDADPRAIADRGAERGGEQEERVRRDRLGQAGRVGDGGDEQPDQDHAQAARGLPAGAPPEQGVGQDQGGRDT
jgi:hypothetical protein